jgi:hypothetical protein
MNNLVSFQPRTTGSNGEKKHEASFVMDELTLTDYLQICFCLKFHPDTMSPYGLIGNVTTQQERIKVA